MDREKVIGLLLEVAEYFRECRSNASFASKAENHFFELQSASSEAAELLKEQEVVEPINSYGTFRCGNCRNIVGYNDGHGRGYQNNFCSKCGQAVKWE